MVSQRKEECLTQLRIGPLVRAIGSESVAIWTEWTDGCDVVLDATHVRASEEQAYGAIDAMSTCSHTVKVGGHHYALLHLTGLQPATWYSYTVTAQSQEVGAVLPAEESIIQCFRTFDLPEASAPLRVAYGSCRNLSTPEPDALSAFGSWLKAAFDEREALWPRLLLLIGDQIYADQQTIRETFPSQNAASRRLPRGAHTFEEFASLYEDAWARDAGIRQVLAVLPTYMIFDDHEITNGWNIEPGWRVRALRRGLEQTLVDGLVAYWLYQGWGNLSPQQADNHPLAELMRNATRSGEDALESLRTWVRHSVYQEMDPHWRYEIATMPPIFVADVRADRPASLREVTNAADLNVPARIISQKQMEELQTWMQHHASTTTILVSSVPLLLPPVIGCAEYIAGIRPFQRGPLRCLGNALAGFQQKLSRRMSFDHWPVFAATWRELVKLLSQRQHDIVVLSGDVHFSYAAQARTSLFHSQKRATLYQLVASPFRNNLSKRDRGLILKQSLVKRLFYGGLHIATLPLVRAKGTKRVPHDLLMQNTVALVTFRPGQTGQGEQGRYRIRQVYMGVQDGKSREIARTDFEAGW